MYAWLAKRIIEHRRKILVVMFALAALFATTVPDLRFDFTPQQMFQSTSSASAYRDKFAKRFGHEDNLVTIAVLGDDVFRPDVLTTMRDLTFALRKLDSTKQAESLATFRIPRSGDSPGTMTVDPVLPQQTGAAAKITEADAQRLRKVAMDEPLVRGRLVGKKANAALVVAWLRDDMQSATDLKKGVDSIQAQIANYPLPKGYEYRVSGIPKLRTVIVDELRHEQLTFLPLTGLIYVLLLGFLFRRLSGVLLPVLTVGFAVLATVALLVWTGSPINIVNNVLPSLIFIIGISDSIHMLARDSEEFNSGKERVEATRSMVSHAGLACLLTSLTTAVGFISLVSAHTDILQNLGWQAAAGVMFAYFATLFFLPAALSYMRPVRRPHTNTDPEADEKLEGGGLLERYLVTSGEHLLRHAGAVIVLSLLVAAGFGLAASRVRIDTTLLEVFQHDHPTYKTSQLIEKRLGGYLPIEVSLEANQKDRFKDPKIYAKIARFEKFAATQPEVLSTQSIVDFHQAARVALLGDPAERDKMPSSRAQIEQLQLLIAGAPDDPTGVNRFVTSDFKNARVLLRVSDVGARAQLALAKRLKKKLHKLFPQSTGVRYRLTGDAYVASVSLDSFIRDLFYSLMFAMVIIFGMMTLVFRSIKLGLISILPNTIPLVMTFGYMGLRGINLDTSTIIIFAISLGLAVDDTIHFIARFQEEREQHRTVKDAILHTYYGAGRAILLTSVMLVMGLSVLLTSNFVPTQHFGILTGITIGGALLGDLILLPNILYLVYREKDEDEEMEPEA